MIEILLPDWVMHKHLLLSEETLLADSEAGALVEELVETDLAACVGAAVE